MVLFTGEDFCRVLPVFPPCPSGFATLHLTLQIDNAPYDDIITRPSTPGKHPAVFLVGGLGCYSLADIKPDDPFFQLLSAFARNDLDHFIRNVKKEETRLRRAQHAAEYLMEAMEAELDPPPMIKAAFARNAKARQGWELMPESLRRQYLIFIFRGRYPETRALYIERTVLDAAEYADRHTSKTIFF